MRGLALATIALHAWTTEAAVSCKASSATSIDISSDPVIVGESFKQEICLRNRAKRSDTGDGVRLTMLGGAQLRITTAMNFLQQSTALDALFRFDAGPTRAARTYQGDSPVAITRVARV